MIIVANKKRNLDKLKAEYPDAYILDITSSSPYHYGQILSPFYPHRNIPIPGESRGLTATCVEAIWQGLKVFANADVDKGMFNNDTMKNIKRTVRRFGKPLGHRYGVFSNQLLNYADARRYIYVPSYKYVLDNVPEVHAIVERIKKQSESSDIVLLDYNTNPDNRDITKPLSHAELVKMYIEERYPEKDEDFIPLTAEELKSSQRKRPCKPSSQKKKVALDEATLISRITELLKNDEYSAKDICETLRLSCGVKSVKKYLDAIPGLKTRKENRRIYYTLLERDTVQTLF